MNDCQSLTFSSASDIAAAIRHRQVSAEDMLKHYLARIERHNTDLNAVVAVASEAALAAARDADQALANGLPIGPLHGVPMTIKEAFDIGGMASSWGLTDFRDNIASSDALAVQRYRQAGAIIFGKTNVPSSLADWQTFNPVYGSSANPWDLTRTPGGSSGGSAAALAAGLSALETGSDIGASIRNPAHYCGVYGHKPTFGIASSAGHALPDWRGWPELDIAVVGPMARSAADLRLALQTMAGPDPIDAVGWQLTLPQCPLDKLSDFSVGIIYSDDEAEVDQAIVQQLQTLADFLREAGVTVREQHRPAIDSRDVHETYLALLRAATSAAASDSAFEQLQQRAAEADPVATDYQSRMLRGTTMSHREWLYYNEIRHRMRRQWHSYFSDTDLLLCPAATSVAFAHNQQGERWERMIDVNGQPQPTTTALFWAGYSGLVYLPSTVAPIGLAVAANGVGPALPVGVQIVGPQYQDMRCIRFAELLEQHYHRFQPPPAYQDAQ